MSGRCPPSADLTALLDLGLDDEDRESLQSHLLDCYLCRDELADLKRTRDLLNRSLTGADGPAQPSADLAARLVNIAGEVADQPLWTRPFDNTRETRASPIALPSRARRHRHRVLAASMVCAMLVVLVGAGWMAAPDVEAAAVTPGAKSRALLTEGLERRPMGADPALSLLSASELERFRTDAPGEVPSVSTAKALTGPELTKIATAAGRGHTTVSVSGLHQAWWRVGENTYQGTARINSSPGQGSEVSLYDADGAVARQGHLPDTADRLPMSLLAAHYRLRGFASASTIAGVSADLIEASADGRVTARWWVDPQTSMLLWQATYDSDGRLAASAGLVQLHHTKTAFVAHLGPTIAMISSPSKMSMTAVPALAERGWSCASELAGLPLSQMALAGPLGARDSVVYASYGDGVHTIVLSEQNGSLAASTPGLSWDADLRAYRNEHNPTEVSWQSGKKVFTVTSSGGEEHLRRAVASLPHEPPLLRTRTERVLSGWRTIFGIRG